MGAALGNERIANSGGANSADAFIHWVDDRVFQTFDPTYDVFVSDGYPIGDGLQLQRTQSIPDDIKVVSVTMNMKEFRQSTVEAMNPIQVGEIINDDGGIIDNGLVSHTVIFYLNIPASITGILTPGRRYLYQLVYQSDAGLSFVQEQGRIRWVNRVSPPPL